MKCPLSYSYWNWYGQLSSNRKKVTMMLNWTWEINNIHFWNNKFKFVRFISSRIASIFRSETFIFSLFFFIYLFFFFWGGELHPSPCAYDWDWAIIISLQNSMTPSKYFSSKVFNPPPSPPSNNTETSEIDAHRFSTIQALLKILPNSEENTVLESLSLKGTLMQIWKSANIFVFIWK